MRLARVPLAFAMLVFSSACGRDATTPVAPPLRIAASAAVSPDTDSEIVGVLPDIAAINSRLAAKGVKARLTAVQLMVNHDYPPGAPTVYSVDRMKLLPSQFVEHDSRRRAEVGLVWTYDLRHGTAFTRVNGVEQTWTPIQSLIVAANDVKTWTSTHCYNAFFDVLPYPISPSNENIEFIDDFYLGAEAQPFTPVAEITFGGFLPYTLFRQIYGPNGDNVLGVTYQFSFYDANGPTDIDKNGFLDTFWTEIYFNDLYYWGDAGSPGFDPNQTLDLGTVGLHESGHAFGVNHFGRVFQNHGGVKATGHNIMSQIYELNRSVSGEPTSAFCSTYKSWK